MTRNGKIILLTATTLVAIGLLAFVLYSPAQAATSDNMFGSWLNNGSDYGTILLADNNCIWSAGGKLTSKLASVYGTVNDFDWPATTIEEDPLFANPTGYDFRPQNPKVKSGGIKTLYGETQPIGLPIYPKINSVFGKEKSLYEN